MNRKDREITDRAEILDLLRRCDTIRLGSFCGDFPYVVPVSFGLDLINDKAVIYFHGAKHGQKIDCMNENQNVCIEADIFYKVEQVEMGITTRYESVIGFGTVSEVPEKEKVYGLAKILEHYHCSEHPADQCKGLQNTAVYKIVLHSLTGKRNLPSEH